MAAAWVALALLGSVIGAGFASGREIVRFFAQHGRMAFAAVACALATLAFLFLRLPEQLERYGTQTLAQLCVIRLGRRLGRLCSSLFFLLGAITGGAMLCACAELGALVLPMRSAYGLTLAGTLLLSCVLAAFGLRGVALPGAALALLFPVLLGRLLCLSAGEACFLPAMTPDVPVYAACDGAIYGALNAAMLAGALALLLPLGRDTRRHAVGLFALLFGLLLTLGVLVCLRHLPAVLGQPLPFVALSRRLGPGGYVLTALCLYAAALSTLCAMLCVLMQAFLFMPLAARAAVCALCCLSAARIGFIKLVDSVYPLLGVLCAALLLLLCAPGAPQRSRSQPDSPSAR